MAGQLDEANQIAALAATVAIEDILARVHIERGPGLLVQRTESDELGATRRMSRSSYVAADSPAAATAA
jgi:hypothetical protein